MEKCYLVGSRAFGDTLCSTPILRKLSISYGEKFHVVTHNPIVFQNNPYVLSIEKFDGDENDKAEECKSKYETFKTFFKIYMMFWQKDQFLLITNLINYNI